MNTAAVVPAAGSGDRLGADRPKAFIDLAGRSLLERSLACLQGSGVVDSIVVAVPADRTEETKLMLGESATVVAGGRNRTESVRRALAEVGAAEWVLVHDAARPLTPPDLIVRVVDALRAGWDAVVPALPVADTIKAVDDGGVVIATPGRARLRAVQTPQGFRAELLVRAYRSESSEVTDDASMVEQLGIPVHVIDGHPLAFKITTALDLLLATAVVNR